MLISIIIPAYNRAKVIPATLDSILAQTYQDWECIVVDDMSNDDTKTVVLKYVKKDSRFRLLTNERKKGAQGARNTGIMHAQSEWVCLFDSDDYAYPTFLEKMMRFATYNYDVITCDVNAVWVNGSKTQRMYWGGEGNIEKKLMTCETYVNFDDSLIRKSKLFDIGLLDEECKAYQEFDTHLRLSQICNYKWIQEVLVDWMVGGEDTITSKGKLNRGSRCYVIWHNRKRWREISYKSLIHEAKSLFAKTQLKYRWYLIKAVPEILLLLPIVYINIVIRFINRKFNKSIPQL